MIALNEDSFGRTDRDKQKCYFMWCSGNPYHRLLWVLKAYSMSHRLFKFTEQKSSELQEKWSTSNSKYLHYSFAGGWRAWALLNHGFLLRFSPRYWFFFFFKEISHTAKQTVASWFGLWIYYYYYLCVLVCVSTHLIFLSLMMSLNLMTAASSTVHFEFRSLEIYHMYFLLAL